MGATLAKLSCTSVTCSGVMFGSSCLPSPAPPAERGKQTTTFVASTSPSVRRGRRLDARLGEARCARGFRTASQVIEPGERQADRVEAEIDQERQLRPAGDGDRLA